MAPRPAGKPHHVDAGEAQRETEPGDGVLQVIVRQRDHELAGLRQAARRRRRLLLDIKRRVGVPFLRRGDRRRIAQVPDIVLRLGLRREQARRLRPAHDADDVDDALRRALRAGRGILAVGRHEAAVDDDDAAAGKPRRREHPVAGALHVGPEGGTGGVDQRLLPGEELGGECDAGVFVRGRELRPACRRRQRLRRAVEPRGHGRDQVFLPDLAVELPDAEADQDGDAGEREHRRFDHAAAPAAHSSPRCTRRPSCAR